MVFDSIKEEYQDLLEPIVKKIQIGGSSFNFSDVVEFPSIYFQETIKQEEFFGYLLLRCLLLKKRIKVPEQKTNVETRVWFVLYLNLFIKQSSRKNYFWSLYLLKFQDRFLSEYPVVKSRKNIQEELLSIVLSLYPEQYQEGIQKDSDKSVKIKEIQSRIQEEKTRIQQEKNLWYDAQAEIEILRDEIKELKKEIKIVEFQEDRMMLKEKIQKKKEDIDFLRSNKPKIDFSILSSLKSDLKNSKSVYQVDPYLFFVDIENYFIGEFQKEKQFYKDSELLFPHVYDYRYDKEIHTVKDHEISDYEEAERLHPKIKYWKNQFQRALKFKYSTYNIRGLKRGKLDRFKLHKQFSQFKKVEKIIRKTHAITVLISTNTFESSLQEELDFAYILSEVMRPLKVAVEVILFRSYEISSEFPDQYVKNKYGRIHHNVEYEILKDFRDRSTDQILRQVLSCSVSYDHEALSYAANRLLQRKEKQKWLVYFSGGQPTTRLLGITGVILKEIREAGIHLVGIGTGSAWTRSILPQGILLNPENRETDDGLKFFLKNVISG